MSKKKTVRKKVVVKAVNFTAVNLKKTLWDTLQAVKTGDVDYKVANAVASQSREIARIVKLELEMAKFRGKKAGVVSLLGK